MNSMVAITIEYALEKKGNLSLIEAEPSKEKTALGLHFLLSAAEKDEPVLYLSLECNEEILMTRLLPIASGIGREKILAGDLTEEERNILMQSKADIATYPITIENMTAPSISEVTALIKKLHDEGKADIAIIDYLCLMNAEGKNILQELKALAERLSIAVIALEQIPRGSGEVNIDSPYIDNLCCLKREGNEAMLADLKENKAIELYYDPQTAKFSVVR